MNYETLRTQAELALAAYAVGLTANNPITAAALLRATSFASGL